VTVLRRVAVAAAFAGLLATAGCVTLPDGGEVRDQPGDVLTRDAGIRYTPPGPAPGADQRAIVTGFLDAMGASPVQTSTARDFLTRSAAQGWMPQRRTLVYDGVAAPSTGAPGELTLTGADWLDEHGRWRGRLPAGEEQVHLRLERERGEWRIAELPDALLARRSWFSSQYAQYQLHFLDPTYRVLVPEPVFAPRGDQLATSLVRALLAGPPDPDAPWLATRLEGLRLADGAVTVDGGTAQVDLTGSATLPTPASRSELAAQLAWTLRQVPGVRSFEVRLRDTPLTHEGGLPDIPVGQGSLLDPAVLGASTALFGVRDGAPVRVDGGDVEPLGEEAPAQQVRAVSVDLMATQRAEVSADGAHVRLLALDGSGPVTVAQGVDFARPAWDRAGHAWLLDRRTTGAVVSVLSPAGQQVVQVPGVSGHRATHLLVSRDGTRLVVALRSAGHDLVVESRLRWHDDVLEVTPARLIGTFAGLRDLGWDGPTRVVALTSAHDLSEVTWLSLDGAPDGLRATPTSFPVFDDVRSLVSSGAADRPVWAETAKGAFVRVGSASGDHPARGVAELTAVG
jgi:hypothetical protein